jgi:two-component system copper resistance phosphate regulon response regulator CusR
MRILLVEDEKDAARMLAKGLAEQSFAVDVADDGEAALFKAGTNDYDLIILDVLLPLRNGFDVCRTLRSEGLTIPILMLTARAAVRYRVNGLDCGADDYLVKPFDFSELLARIRALLRRNPELIPEIIRIGDLEIDTGKHAVQRQGKPIPLTAREYALLEYLARKSGQVVSRAEMSEHVWDENYDPFSNLIEVYIQRLRRKIDRPGQVRLIHTRRGEGYQLWAEENPNHV